MKKRNVGALLCALVLSVGCMMAPVSLAAEPAPTGKYPNIPHMSLGEYPKVDGSTAYIPLGMALMQAVTGCTPAEAESATVFSTTDISYQALVGAEGFEKADILLAGGASDATKKEVVGYDQLQIESIGRDALVFLVNEKNPVQSLTADQLRSIYAGKITNWKDVGGQDQPILAFQRQEKSGSQTRMKKFMGDVKLAAPPEEMIMMEMRGLVDAIGGFDASQNALGYSTYYYAHNMYELPGVKLLAVDGVMPSNETIQSGAYPYVSDFYCVLPKEPTSNAQLLRDWLVSEEGQAFVAENGYVPVR